MLSVAEGISNGSLPFQFFSASSIKKTGFDLKSLLQLTIWEKEEKRLRVTLDKMQEFCRSFDFI